MVYKDGKIVKVPTLPIGAKLKCIKNEDNFPFTVGKEYNVFFKSPMGDDIRIIDDSLKTHCVWNADFELLPKDENITICD